MMPSRSNATVPQHCIGCDRAFCGAYWHSLGVTGGEIHPVCSREILKPIMERTVSRMPFLVHEKNRHEQDITEKCIRQMGKSLQDVISDWVTKMNNRELDRTRLPLNHSEIINPQTYVCNIYLQRHCIGMTAGMDQHVEHSTIMKNMLGRGTMSVVRRGVPICHDVFTMLS
ncbi:hypothetical protein F511_44315 [Dorcoceras hygrometricum]|uniref:E3 ubiquitin-protein ligase CHFR cysteine rich domain-containing protein n=1 Tax=Dorcoceras hygrometricum TaxID=472368 RepID=A0A2Z6ZY59_9LAMI|nr:hypothetical protein F511_44315 [Dorcoceras hygrometricum]